MIHIQSTAERSHKSGFSTTARAMFGALDNGLSPRFTSMEEVLSGKLNTNIRHDMYVGLTEFMREILELNIDPSRSTQLPCPHRSTRSLSAVPKAILSNSKPLFVKPATQQKLFTGLVLRNAHFLNTYPDDAMVLMYTPFDTRPSYLRRGCMCTTKPMFIGNYSGTSGPPRRRSSCVIINDVCKDFPVCYTIDVSRVE